MMLRRKVPARRVYAGFFALVAMVACMACTGSGPSTLKGKDTRFAVAEGEDVVQIDIRDSLATVSLTKSTSGEWMLTGQRGADEVAVNNLLLLMQGLAIVMPVPSDDQKTIQEQLVQHGTYVDIYAHRYLLSLPGNINLFRIRKHIRHFIVGGMTRQVDGNYFMMQDASQAYVVHVPGFTGDIRHVFSRQEHRWFDPVILNYTYDQIRRIEVSVPGMPEESFVLQHDVVLGYRLYNGSGEILDEQTMDAQRIERYLYGFEELFYEEVIVDEEGDAWKQIRSGSPFLQMQITDKGGQTSKIICYKRIMPGNHPTQQAQEGSIDPDRFFIVLDNGLHVVAQYMIFNRILRTLSFFRMPSEPALPDS